MAPVPAAFKELQAVVDAGRVQDLDNRSTVKQALWTVAGELGLLAPPESETPSAPSSTDAEPGAALAVRVSGPVARLRGGDRGALGPWLRRGREG